MKIIIIIYIINACFNSGIFCEDMNSDTNDKRASELYKEFDTVFHKKIDNQKREWPVTERNPKIYLEDLIKDLALKPKYKPEYNIGTCKLENIEMSLKIENCGRVLFNTTSCTGYCKSKSIYISNTNLVKTICSGCKIIDFRYETYKVRCTDNSIKDFKIKAVSKCSCFKIYDKLDSLTIN